VALYLQFLLDTAKGFMVVAAIPMIIFMVYSVIKVGGFKGVLAKKDELDRTVQERRAGTKKSKSNGLEDGSYTEDEWARMHKFKPNRLPGGKWFCPQSFIACGFHDISKATKKNSGGYFPAVFWLEVASGFILYPFLGHAACIVLIRLMQSGWEPLVSEFVILNSSFLLWHLTLATTMALAEFILSLIIYILKRMEYSVTTMLSKIREHFCQELGEARGNEAARFLALLMDMYFDKQDIRSVKAMACKQKRMSGKAFASYLVALYEEKRAIPGTRMAIPLTEEGQELYQDICSTL
jgi:hypothetical protein